MRKLFMILSLLIMLVLLAFLTPGSALLPSAFGEEALPQLVPVALDTSVAALSVTDAAPYAPHSSGFAQDGSGYHDDTLDVQVNVMRAYDTTITVTYIQLANASQLRTEQAQPYPSKRTGRPDLIAKRVNAVLAINADYFIYHSYGIIYRQGKLLRTSPNEEFDALAIDDQGNFHIISPVSEEGFAALERPVINSFCFGPGLVINGELQEIRSPKFFSPEKKTQRMAIAQLAPLTYMAVAAEGPDDEGSVGLTLVELAQLMYDLGSQNAYNLDGGSSTCVVLNGQKINTTRTQRIRAVGDILYFVTAKEE